MDVAVTFQTDPPASRVIELTPPGRVARVHPRVDVRLAHPVAGALRHLLADARRDRADGRRADGDQPGDPRLDGAGVAVRHAQRDVRDRTICGMGRGDSALRVLGRHHHPGHRPGVDASDQEACAEGRSIEYAGRQSTIPWVPRRRARRWMAGYGPRRSRWPGARPTGSSSSSPTHDCAVDRERSAQAAAAAGPRPGGGRPSAWRRRRTSATTSTTQREQCRWFGGMVGNHVADLVPATARTARSRRRSPSTSRRARATTTPTTAARATPTRSSCPDEIVDRFCVLGTADDHVAKLRELETLGVTQFSVYLMHDAQDETLEAYGSSVIPAFEEGVRR